VLRTFERFKQGAVKDYRIRYRTWPGINHVTAEILERVARLFPEEFTALDEYCHRHTGFADEGILRADRELQFYLAYRGHIEPLRAACPSAIPRSPPPRRKSAPPAPSTWPWPASSSRSAGP
jgi:hypothetical protein